jgi:hypothetical protein
MSFSNTFIKIIQNCIEDIGFSIMVRGSTFNFYKSTRSLKQGVPLSSILFILVEEVLSYGLTSLRLDKKIGKFTLQNGISRPSHMLFANDTIIYTNGRKGSLENLLSFLEKYQDASRQRINKRKS